MRGLQDRVAVVTGAANGIGAATTHRLHQEGAKVVLLDIAQTGGKALADQLGAERALFVACDITSEEQAAAAIGATIDHFGRVDILVNNAGVNAYFDAETMTLQEWEQFFALDLRACWLCSKHVLPHLRRQRRGVIVNIASIHARLTVKGMFPYAAAKSGIVGLTRSLALDYGSQGIRVVAISPGWTRTRLVWRRRWPSSPIRRPHGRRRWRSIPSAASPSPTRSPRWSPSPPRKTPASSPASPFRSTAASAPASADRPRPPPCRGLRRHRT
jgi:NAD(P)-dependent dehydrogenase (short-subunit alcohol dehydrogenase family)